MNDTDRGPGVRRRTKREAGADPGSTGPLSDPRLDLLREDLEAVVAGALQAVDPERLVRQALQERATADADRTVHLISVGKAALGMARGALLLLGDRIRSGIVLTPDSSESRERARSTDWPTEVALRWGGHPLPDEAGVRAAGEIRELAASAGEGESILLLLSGGGSALLTLPRDGIGLSEIQEVTRGLLSGGADIGELNTVRKHLDLLKGGWLARSAAPTPIEALVLSDVVGDPLDVIASGPVSPDPTTFQDAQDVLVRRLAGTVPATVEDLFQRGAAGELEETPKPGDLCFADVRVSVVGNAFTALLGAAEHAGRRGYEVRRGSTRIKGDARDAGIRLGEIARVLARESGEAGRPVCFVSAGETTVTVTGEGHGGRNQELTLSAGLEAAGGTPFGGDASDALVMVASVGTDGVDGIHPDGTDPVAGAWVVAVRGAPDHPTGLLPAEALVRNDTYRHLAEAVDPAVKGAPASVDGPPSARSPCADPGGPLGGGLIGGHVLTGPTGTNVMDLQIVLARPPGHGGED